MTIYWVDDDYEILDLVKTIFNGVTIHTYVNWKYIPELKKGDIVFHNHDGVGPMPEKVEGVRYFRCSGTCEDIKVDFPKPFDVNAIEKILTEDEKRNNLKEEVKIIEEYSNRPIYITNRRTGDVTLMKKK